MKRISKKQEAANELARLTTQVASLQEQIKMLTVRLNEARRHTLPTQEGDAAINFMPLCVTKVVFDVQHDGYLLHNNRSCVLTVLADMVQDPPIIYPSCSKS